MAAEDGRRCFVVIAASCFAIEDFIVDPSVYAHDRNETRRIFGRWSHPPRNPDRSSLLVMRAHAFDLDP